MAIASGSEVRGQKRQTSWVLLLVLGIALGVLLSVAFAHLASAGQAGLWNRVAELLTGRTTIDTSSASVIEKVRQLSRLETVEYSIDKIVEGERENLLLPNLLAGDKLLLIAHAEVIAGVDLSGLNAADLRVSGSSVRIVLPKPQIFSARLDSAHTRVYARDTGLLVGADPDLETKVRQAAEQQIEQAAIADGILEKARVNARANVTSLLYALGFRTVDVS